MGDSNSERVLLAIIDLANGSVEALDHYCDQARGDWRDVLYWNERPLGPGEPQSYDQLRKEIGLSPDPDGGTSEARIRSTWDRLIRDASKPPKGWFDRGLTPLVNAAAPTALRRFFPFSSHNRFCFAETPYPFEGLQAAFIEFLPDGEFVVYSDPPYWTTPPGSPVLTTSQADQAVSEVVRVLGLTAKD